MSRVLRSSRPQPDSYGSARCAPARMKPAYGWQGGVRPGGAASGRGHPCLTSAGGTRSQRSRASDREAVLLLLPRHALHVKFELLPLEDVPVGAAALAGARREARKQPARVELAVDVELLP